MAEAQWLPMLVTTDTIAGYRITRILGMASVGTMGTRQNLSWAVDELARRTAAAGGNAVVGVRLFPFVQGRGGSITTEFLVYGTGVVVEPEAG
jgi:uncharacterized protein YbjQ (UPF0145 family)